MNMKNIFGAVILGAFAGVPFFAMANVCVYGDTDYDVVSCANSGGTIGTPNPPSLDNIQVRQSGASSDNIRVGSSGLSASPKLQNPIKYNTFSAFAAAVTKTAVQVLMPFIVLAFIYSGFLFVKAQGNVEDLKKAKTAIIYSMLGAFILLGAWGFAQIIGQTVSTLTQ